MYIEEKFNLKSAKLVEVQSPMIRCGGGLALGLTCVFTPTAPFEQERRVLRMHLTPYEALAFAHGLVAVATDALRSKGIGLDGPEPRS